MNNRRIVGLDAWRAILMLGGIFLHASLLKEQRPLFLAINITSDSFRMGAFLFISGMLSSLALTRRPPEAWLRNRLFQLGIPTCFALAVICPLVTSMLFAMSAELGTPRPPLFDWHHIWFLVALLLYAPIAYLLHELDRQNALFSRLDESSCAIGLLRRRIFLWIPAVSFLLMALTSTAIESAASEKYLSPLLQWKFIVGYAPLFCLGFGVARSACLREALIDRRIPIVTLATVIACHLLWNFGASQTPWGLHRQWVGELIMLGGSAIAPIAASALIIGSAMKIQRIPPFIERLSAASLTIYLVHLPIIVVINIGFVYVAWNEYLEYGIAVLGSGLLSYAIHYAIVARSPTAALLLNGKRSVPRAPLRKMT